MHGFYTQLKSAGNQRDFGGQAGGHAKIVAKFLLLDRHCKCQSSQVGEYVSFLFLLPCLDQEALLSSACCEGVAVNRWSSRVAEICQMTITELPNETTLHLPRRSERYTEVKKGWACHLKNLKRKNRLIFGHGTNPNVGTMLASQMSMR
jgi:hypothetical protein